MNCKEQERTGPQFRGDYIHIGKVVDHIDLFFYCHATSFVLLYHTIS